MNMMADAMHAAQAKPLTPRQREDQILGILNEFYDEALSIGEIVSVSCGNTDDMPTLVLEKEKQSVRDRLINLMDMNKVFFAGKNGRTNLYAVNEGLKKDKKENVVTDDGFVTPLFLSSTVLGNAIVRVVDSHGPIIVDKVLFYIVENELSLTLSDLSGVYTTNFKTRIRNKMKALVKEGRILLDEEKIGKYFCYSTANKDPLLTGQEQDSDNPFLVNQETNPIKYSIDSEKMKTLSNEELSNIILEIGIIFSERVQDAEAKVASMKEHVDTLANMFNKG